MSIQRDAVPAGRREFMRMTGLALGGALGGCWSVPALATARIGHPDMVVFNARVYTVDTDQPTAQAFAIKGGRFVAVGSNDEIKGYAGPATKQVDAAGATILPGFNDAHIHADGRTLLYEVLVGNPFDVEIVTIDAIVAKLRKRADETPPGHWVTGYFHDDTKVKDGRLITRLDLDRVSTQHPVRVVHRGGHTSFYNSKAFELAGITKDSPDPPGGEYFHDASGLSGRVAERANAVFGTVGQRPVFTPQETAERARAGAAHFSRQLVRYGITSIQAGAGSVADVVGLQQLRASGELRHRVSLEVSGKLLDAMMANGIRSGFGDEWIRFGATSEYIVDGSFSERTARLTGGYPGIRPAYFGIMTRPQEELDAWCAQVHRAGIRLNCHANGDDGIAATLTAYERALAAHPVADARPKITHCSVVDADLVRRIKAIGAVPASFTTYLYYNSDKFHFYGHNIMRRTLAFRSFLDAGIPAAAGSDYGPGPFNALMGIQGMVTRRGWNGEVWGANQRVSVAEAVRIYTLNGAYCSKEEAEKGSITPGKHADFVVLDRDPHIVAPEEIRNVRVLQTFTGGRAVYEA